MFSDSCNKNKNSAKFGLILKKKIGDGPLQFK